MAPSSKMWESNYRIPESTLPLHYDLYLFPDLDQKTFSGHVTIHIKATEPRDYLVTHVQYLKVTKTELKDADQNVVPLDSSFEYEPNQFWVVVPSSKPLQAGNYSLYLEFNGRLDRDILGFYMSSYTDSSGGQHKIASSKFQPTYARRVRLYHDSFQNNTHSFISLCFQAFPCFDEPSFKSTFKTTLIKPSSSDYIAISNMPEENSIPNSPKDGKYVQNLASLIFFPLKFVCLEKND